MQANLLDSAGDCEMAKSVARRAASTRGKHLDSLAKANAARAESIKRQRATPMPCQMDLFSIARMESGT